MEHIITRWTNAQLLSTKKINTQITQKKIQITQWYYWIHTFQIFVTSSE